MADYLTSAVAWPPLSDPSSKQVRIEYFAERRREPRPPGELGGAGWPDPDIFSFCDWLNALPRVYTMQSCAGHQARPGSGEYPGNLWIWMPPDAVDRLRADIDRYARDPVEYIRILLRREGEIVDISFAGNNVGRLAESLQVLRSMFEEVVR